ncbi:hypothetical protein LSTR_LSTR002184, partial [Laodelphax striatellus]
MSLSLKVKHFQLGKCKGDKIAKATFRGVSHSSRLLEDKGELVIVDQKFEWPVARPVECHEVLSVQLYTHNRYLSDKLVGSYSLVLQKVVSDGRISVCDTLVDPNNKPLPATVDIEITYYSMDEASAAPSSHPSALDMDQQMLVDIEQNIANLERSMSNRRGSWQSTPSSSPKSKKAFLMRGGSLSAPEKERSPNPERKSRTLKASVKNLIRLGKQRPGREDALLLPEAHQSLNPEPVVYSCPPRAPSLSSLSSDNESISSTAGDYVPSTRKLAKQNAALSTLQSALKAQDFQVCVTIIEARQLAGLNMDPVVCVQVGDVKKYTSVKESTNCPYYNEYFVFDFHMPAVMLFDKIITLSVMQSRNILRSDRMLGSFKLDVATVWSHADHQFFHKWALLTDPDDIAGGPKGYLKCDISVIGKGDTVKVPPKSEKDEDDIEANLLLPDGVPVERQRARFIVRIYRADGLPKMNSTIMANVKKAFTGDVKDLVDPYVQVSFAGLVGKTSVRKHSYAPVWNEQLVFNEMFPPLCQRIKIQLRDNDPVNKTIIGTHFIDLKTISNDGEKGFLPTFGPTFIHLYGSTRDYSLIDEHSNLNSGLGEGVSYRARLLIAIRTEITDNVDMAPSQTSYAKTEEFFLFTTILEASMIDKKLGEKPLFFELSIGNAGNTLDGHNETAQQFSDEDNDSDDNLAEVVTSESLSWQSTTSPIKPMTHDRTYYFLPYWDDKPCMHVRSLWPDYRRRMYNSNMIAKIVEKLEEGLSEVSSLIDGEEGAAERKLRAVLDELSSSCAKYTSVARGNTSGSGVGRTKLDKERMKLCLRDIEQIGNMSRNLKALVTKHSFKDRHKTAASYLQKLRFLIEDPQHSIPDIFIWLISSGKRTAYQRIPARDLIFSIVDEESGRHCGKVHSIFLKLPGKKGMGPSGWAIQAKLQAYMWLGLVKHKKNFVNGLTKGYEISHEIRNAERPRALPPSMIHYKEKYPFQMRAYMYQARSLIGSDASGLSDPFARVIIGEYCKTTQVIDETLSPTWDELLVFDEILIYGSTDEIKKDPPTIIIEIFDQDKVGKSEFIGRALAKPHVKLLEEPYEKPNFPPCLEWYDIQRGPERAGELLATFELLQLKKAPDKVAGADLPDLPPPKELLHPSSQPCSEDGTATTSLALLPVPRGIRPTLAKYRIEVLFWGLRDLKRVHLLTVDKPRVDIECAGHILYSSVIQNAKKNPNFATPVKFLELELPEQELYRPPLTIRAVDCRSFGRFTLVGTHMINSIHKYMYTPQTKRDREAEERKRSLLQLQEQQQRDGAFGGLQMPQQPQVCANNQIPVPSINSNRENVPLLIKDSSIVINYGSTLLWNKKDLKVESNKKRKQSMEFEIEEDDEHSDWWTKYFASVEAMIEESKEARKEKKINMMNGSLPIHLESPPVAEKSGKKFGHGAAAKIVAKLSPKSIQRKQEKTAKLRIYPSELESQSDFNGFSEWLQTFDLYRGKKTGDDVEDDSRVVGTFKGAIKVYKWPLPKDIEDHTIMGLDPQYGFFQGLPNNDPIHVLVRVYVVKANELHPMDLNGKADPYVLLQLGNKRISDKDNYISKQLNPVFG